MKRKSLIIIVFGLVLAVSLLAFYESSVWARAGGGMSSGSRGSRSFSAPSMPSSPSPGRTYSTPGSPSRPGYDAPGTTGLPGSTSQPSSGWFSRSPFWQGLAGGMAGGLLGSLLFGGRGYAAPGMGYGGGGIGLLDIILLGLILYFAYRFFKKRREQREAVAYYGDVVSPRQETAYGGMQSGPYQADYDRPYDQYDELDRGIDQIRRFDPYFQEDTFKEHVQDMFFKIQAGWMNRRLDGIEDLLADEMKEFFKAEFQKLIQQGRINRLENIAVRKVELSEAWQEQGKDYVTVFFTANLLDYTVDDKTGEVVSGDKMNPVKFQEFWTFCRDIGSGEKAWKLSAINQVGEPSQRH